MGLIFGSGGGLVSGVLIGAVLIWFIYRLDRGEYRKDVPLYNTAGQTLWHNSFMLICGLIFFFLIAPLLPVMWLSFNAQDFFIFTP